MLAHQLHKKPHFPPFLLIVATFAALWSTAVCAERYRHPTLGFSVTIPEQLERVELASRGVALVLRRKDSVVGPMQGASPANKERFPTLTVTVHPGILSLEPQYVRARIDEVLSSYRSIGFPRVEEISHSVRSLGERSYLELNLRYPRQENQMYRSVVSLFPAGKAHYILTFIEKESDFAQSQPIIEQILTSFSAGETPPPTRPAKKPKERDRWALLGFVVFSCIALAALIGYQTRRRDKAANSDNMPS